MLLLGQSAWAQAGKQVTSVHHVFTAESKVWEKEAGSEDATFTYDAQGRILTGHTLVTLPSGNMEFNTTFGYNESAQTVTSTTSINVPGLPPGYSIQMLTEAKLENNLVKELTETNIVTGAGQEIDKQFFERDSEGRIIKVSQTDPDHPDRDTYDVLVWEGGNIVSTTTSDKSGSSDVTLHSYDLTHEAPQKGWPCYMVMGAPFQVSALQIMLAALDHFGPASKNLLSSNKYSSHELTFAYEFDADGDVSKLEVRKDGTLVSTYTFGLSSAGIGEVIADRTDSSYYTLQGYRVAVPKKGQVYICNGRKVVVK